MKRWFALLPLAACSPPDKGTDEDTAVDSDDTADDVVENCWNGFGEVGIEVGQCAPAFALPDREGTTRELAEHAGDIILVDCSAMW